MLTWLLGKNPPTPKQFEPVAARARTRETTEEIREYLATCERMELDTPPTRLLKLKLFLEEQNMLIYDSDQVQDHLKKLARAAHGRGAIYYWYPLRQKDLDAEIGFLWNWEDARTGEDLCETAESVYPELIPTSALNTAEKIQAEFPDAIFFVSDILDVDDPFLLVAFEDSEGLVVDFWNEPSFRPVSAALD